MRYVPKKADDTVNVSKEHPLVEASTLVVGLTLIFAAVAAILILLVDLVLLFVPPEREATMFANWLPDDIVAVSHEDDRVVALQALTARLAGHWEDSPYEFRVEISEDDDMNAMALPGGLIIVTSGLLDRAESENEIAFVLGHEIGHFSNRDHIRALGRGIVLSIFLAAIGGTDGIGNIGLTISDLTLRGFSRKQESDADKFGLQLVFEEYGHVADSWRFFERIDGADDPGIDLAAYLSTHPSPDNRIERLHKLAEENGWPVTGPVVEFRGSDRDQ